MTFMHGEDAVAVTGKSVAEIDEAAATGAVDARYHGWLLHVDVDLEEGPGTERRSAHQHHRRGERHVRGRVQLQADRPDPVPAHRCPDPDALIALPNIGAGNVHVDPTGPADFDVHFVNALGGKDVSQLVPDNGKLLPTGTAKARISTVVHGSGTKAKKTPAKTRRR